MLTFTLKYFPDLKQWRVTGQMDDQYWTADSVDDLPRCVRGMMRYQAEAIEVLAIEPDKK